MSRVPWSRYEGDDVEAFAAMCICRERPSARRIRPSRGDGGIDVYVPLGDNHVEVYQVKKFAANLTSNQLGQIIKSYNRIKVYAAKRGWTIDAWHLTLPLNATPENDTWFDELTKADPFEATWKGLEVFDNWAADFPQVVDHYLEGGSKQLAQELSRFHTTTKIMLPEVDPETALQAYRGLEPAAVLDRIALLNTTLNDADPHYIYDFAVGTTQAEPPNLPDGYPALVTSVSNQVEGRVVTVHILARCAESLYERPITHKGTIVADIAPALGFLHHMFAPNTFRISNPRAVRRKHDQLLTHSKPRNRETRAVGIHHDYIQALATIQQYADNEIKIPDLDSITPDEASETIRIGRLLRESDITVGWDELSVDVHKGVEAPEPEVPHAWVADVPLQISIAGTTIPLGWMRAVFEAGQVAKRKIGKDGGITVVIRPALGKNTARLMWAGPDSIND